MEQQQIHWPLLTQLLLKEGHDIAINIEDVIHDLINNTMGLEELQKKLKDNSFEKNMVRVDGSVNQKPSFIQKVCIRGGPFFGHEEAISIFMA